MFSLLFLACTSSEYEYDFHAPKMKWASKGFPMLNSTSTLVRR